MKAYCYKDECEFVVTGFQFEQYTVCTVCKLEVNQVLVDRKKLEQERLKKIEDAQKDTMDEESQRELWHFF